MVKAFRMQEGAGEAYLRDMANKCRLLADHLLDERSAASLRSLADEYEKAAKARRELDGFAPPAPEASPPTPES
jgi:hypothetical protein